MRNPLKRYYGHGDLHFITFSCYRRRPMLGRARSRDRFLKVLNEVRAQWGFRLLGFVVMPEHIHLLVGEPSRGNLSKAIQMLKQKTSRTLRKTKGAPREQLRFRFGAEELQEAHFWQRRFYDFNVWSRPKCKEKLLYMHANPVRRGLVSHPKDWPWSSWSHHAKGAEGLILIDQMD